jgi:hypothetical protein
MHRKPLQHSLTSVGKGCHKGSSPWEYANGYFRKVTSNKEKMFDSLNTKRILQTENEDESWTKIERLSSPFTLWQNRLVRL